MSKRDRAMGWVTTKHLPRFCRDGHPEQSAMMKQVIGLFKGKPELQNDLKVIMGFLSFKNTNLCMVQSSFFWLCNPPKRFRWSRSPRKWPDPWDSRSSAAGGEIGQLLQAELVYCINPISTRFQEWFKPVQASIFEGFWGYDGMIFRGMRNWCHGDLMLVNGMWMGFYIIKCQ